MLFRLLAVFFGAAALFGCTRTAPPPEGAAAVYVSPERSGPGSSEIRSETSLPHDRSAAAGPVRIVVVGASNTAGWGVGKQNAFPAKLEALLRAQGIKADVENEGVVAATTIWMLRRIDSAVPDGTDLVILQPGGNDLRFLGSRDRRQANIAAIERRLRDRGVKLIVFDPLFPPDYFGWDGIHFTAAAHARIAADLAPMVMAALNSETAS